MPDISLDSGSRLKGEDKQLFLCFMRKMLQWRPEDRANLLLFDEWLLADVIEEAVLDPSPKSVVECRVAKTSLSTLSYMFQNQACEDACRSNST